MLKKLMLAAAALPLVACSTTELANSTNMIRQARVAADTASVASDLASRDRGEAVAPVTADYSDASPIDASPMPVKLKKTNGKTSVLSMQPKIAVAGYNIGGLTYVSATGKAGGSLFSNSQGSRSTVELTTQGVDADLLSRIAQAAHDDLVAQLIAAGFDVVPADQVAAASHAAPMKFGTESYEKSYTGEGKRKVLVAGPPSTGVRDYYAIAKTTMGGNGVVKLSDELDAVVLLPNLVFDFAAVKTGGVAFGGKSSASATTSFAIDSTSAMNIQVSKDGRFLDGWLAYGLDGDAVSDEPFATVGDAVESNNALERGLGMALGMGVANKKTSEAIVAVDPVRYEALALKAARGWNAAFVAEIKSQTSS